MTSLRLETITTPDAMRALEPEWRALFEQSGAALPFLTFDWAVAWWQHLHRDRRSVRDLLRLQAVRNEADELVAVVPMMMTERPATGPFRIRFMQFIGADRNITEVRGLLALPSYEQEVYHILTEHLDKEDWDWICWTGLRHGAGGEEALSRKLSRADEAVSDFYLMIPESWEAFHKGLKRNIRESLRKCYNSLRRDNHTFEMRIASTPEEVERAVERFVDLHGARAASEASLVRHADVFAPDEAHEFLNDICRRFAERGETRIFELVIAGEVVATRIGFQFTDSLYLYYSGYNPAWAKYSVMTTTVAEAIKYAIGQGLSRVNLSTGRDVSKTRWQPSETAFAAGIQIAPSPRAHVAFKLNQQGLQLRSHKSLGKALRILAR